MRIKTTDLIAFTYCPFMYHRGGTDRFVPPLSPKEQMVRESILGAEQRALDQNSYVTAPKIGNIWEKLWWPAANEQGLEPFEIEEISVKMSRKFVDYAKYDIASPQFETVGLDVKSEIQLGKCIVETNIDLVKVPLFEHTDKIYLIDFTRKDLRKVMLANDITVLANMYAFKGLNRDIAYICVDLSEKLQKLTVTSTYYQVEDIDRIGKTLNYIAEGIYKGIDYQYSWMCDRCTKCGRK